MVDEYSLVSNPYVKTISATQKCKHLPFGRILRRRFSHEGEKQTAWVVGADELAMPGTWCKDGSDVSSFEAGVCEQLSHTVCDVIHCMPYFGFQLHVTDQKIISQRPAEQVYITENMPDLGNQSNQYFYGSLLGEKPQTEKEITKWHVCLNGMVQMGVVWETWELCG